MPKKGESKYTRELCHQIFTRMGNGLSARQAVTQAGIDWTTFMDWVAEPKDPEWLPHHYAHAREACLEYWAAEIVDISDDDSRDVIDGPKGKTSDNTAVNRDRLKIDSRKWLMSKLNPKKYGDVTKHELSGKLETEIVVNYSPKKPD